MKQVGNVHQYARFGINADHAANYHAGRQGIGVICETVSDAICRVRRCSAPLSAGWKRKVDEVIKTAITLKKLGGNE